MLDKFTYKIFESVIPGNIYIYICVYTKPKLSVYVKQFLRCGKTSFFYFVWQLFGILQKWWKNQNLKLLPSKF